MSRIPDREVKLADIQRMMHERSLLAQYWMAMATTGAATRKKISQGREPTEEEKAAGHCIGWRPYTPEELTDNALNIALRHIDLHRAYGEIQLALLHDDPESYASASDWADRC